GSVTVGLLDSLQIEVGRDPALIFEAAHGMIQRDKACRFKFPLNQGGEITNSATDICDSAFYPGQSFVEDETFIPILRTQT
ncbi:hypothetical protein, partial [Rhizobium johnstonii]|uniref:hypothetical protein n=1 Tax=Rhizobium johnstonii TaxID=3019933 RepID=UPI003F9AC41C